jgi:hypothetical protein
MKEDEAILLIPGLFGFSKLGNISYFDKVIPLLARASNAPEKNISVLDTPPTGPLWRRAVALHEKMTTLGGKYSKVHLVGHSTGGVDARLYANDAYLWPGGPTGGERTRCLDSIGRIISISAPHHGTPIATRLRGAMEVLVLLLFLVSILSKADDTPLAKHVAQQLTAVFAALLKNLRPNEDVERLLRISGIPDETAREIERFMQSIVDDHELIHDLTPLAMETLNARIATGRQLPVVNFVTCGPPPPRSLFHLRLGRPRLLTPFQRAIYAMSYFETRPPERPFPHGPWIGGAKPPNLASFEAVARDGVVPCASQVTDEVGGIVYADHLDVVGHYRGEHGGETVFDSGASFDDERMKALWTAVGACIR